MDRRTVVTVSEPAATSHQHAPGAHTHEPGEHDDVDPAELARALAVAAATTRPAEPADHAALLALAAANPAAERRDREEHGFGPGQLDERALAELAADTGVQVVEVSERIVGFAATSQRYRPTTGPAAEAWRWVSELTFHGRPVRELRPALYGPVLIDAEFRGKGLARRLFRAALRALAGRADVVLLLVPDDDRHSLAVHVNGLGMDCVGGFELTGRRYSVLAHPIAE